MQNINEVIKVVNDRNLKDRIVDVLKEFSDFNPDTHYSTVYCVEDDKFFPYEADENRPDRPATLTYTYYCKHLFITFEYYRDGEIYYGCNFGCGHLWYIKATAKRLLMKVDRSVLTDAD